ncbi:MAG: primosomal protein N' [Bacteroidales bacterium]|nr:primosomal protein N' [Bacteroidales bacterium]
MTEEFDDKRKEMFADVILALHLPFSYTYRVPSVLQNHIKIGQRVAVQLRNRIYSAAVIDIKDSLPSDADKQPLHLSSLKYILDIIDTQPIITDTQIKFFKWVADYYAAYIGDVLTCAMPACFRLKSETTVSVSPYFNSDISSFTDKELKVFDAVAKKISSDKSPQTYIALSDISAMTSLSQAETLKIIHCLIKKDVLITDEELHLKYRPKKETFITLSEEYKDREKLKKLLEEFDKNKRTQQQGEVVLKYLSLSSGVNCVKKSLLTAEGCSASTVETLLKKNVFAKLSKETSRLKLRQKTSDADSIVLNEEQNQCYNDIVQKWNSCPVSLIHGVTGSGKTEVYIKLIEHALRQGGQVLYLLPEIAISMQLIERLEKYFGGRVAVYNSKFSTLERAEIWYNVLHGGKDKEQTFDIILGSRSAVFLPFKDLKLVIIDEEHDTSYKQNEPVPHYNGKDSAMYLAKLFGAKTVLGSATPNAETYKSALEGKYQLCELKHQYHSVPLPEIKLVDMRQALKEKDMYGIFSGELFDKITLALQEKHQVIIFQNRRGYAPHTECTVCGYVPHCPNCDVALVLHKDTGSLQCHYCGYTAYAQPSCPQCGSHSLRLAGMGTEKIEEELQIYFPQAVVKRMDLDSVRTKEAYVNILNDFSQHKIDILCGTQIITKGLDFDNVSLVGVLSADAMLHYPDFRAFERTFQLLTQVSGRAGRKYGIGCVVIQTFEPGHAIMQDVVRRDYLHMYSMQIKERRMLNFPPFCRMIKITLQHKDRNFINQKSKEYALNLRHIFGARLFGPQQPVIARIKNLYSMEIWLKIEKNISYNNAKIQLLRYNEEFLSQRVNSAIRISVDVDPV